MKVAMTLRNVKQKDLANALGVDRSSISQKMTRRVAWSLEDIEKASDFFHVKPEALVSGDDLNPWTSWVDEPASYRAAPPRVGLSLRQLY